MGNFSISYESKVKDCAGAMIINGLSFPENRDFDILAKIWSSVKKRITEYYDVSVVGIFFYENELKLIPCNFYLNFAPVEHCSKAEVEAYKKKYEETFEAQMDLFKQAIESFIEDEENGYDVYCKCIQETQVIEDDEERRKIYNLLLDEFLISINMKTKKDIENRNHKMTILEKAKVDFEAIKQKLLSTN